MYPVSLSRSHLDVEVLLFNICQSLNQVSISRYHIALIFLPTYQAKIPVLLGRWAHIEHTETHTYVHGVLLHHCMLSHLLISNLREMFVC